VKGDKFPLSIGMSIGEQFLEVTGRGEDKELGSQMQCQVNTPAPTLLTAGAVNHPAPKLEVTTCNVHEEARVIKVFFASGEYVELALQLGDTVSDLSRRVADLKDAGWATLVLGTEPLDEKLAVAAIPDGQAVTAMLQDGWERPDRLNKTVREQIRWSVDRVGISVVGAMRSQNLSMEDAFKQPDWGKFRKICQGMQDFRITVFEFAGERYVEYNFGLGDNGFGSLHAVDSVDAIMSYDDGTWEPLVEPWKDVHRNVCCDKCGCIPIIGIRHKSLEQDDYDLCEACFAGEERRAGAWVQPPPDDDDEESDEDEDDDEDNEDGDSDSDEERHGHLEPFFLALVKAKKANQLGKYGVEW